MSLLKVIILVASLIIASFSYGVQENTRDRVALRYLKSADVRWELAKFYKDKRWTVLSQRVIGQALRVPSQIHGPRSLRTWSCGPNSVARSLKLLDQDICPKETDCLSLNATAYEKEYEVFAMSFPKSIGTPGTVQGLGTSLGVALCGVWVSNGLTSVSHKFAAITGLALMGTTPYIIGALGGNVGAPPAWLANHLKTFVGHRFMEVEHFAKKTFPEIRSEVESAIQNQSPVIPLIVFGDAAWHYFVIVGYSDFSVLILDTDGMILEMTYADLAVLMDPGYLTDDSLARYLLAAFVSRISHLGPFNLIRLSATIAEAP